MRTKDLYRWQLTLDPDVQLQDKGTDPAKVAEFAKVIASGKSYATDPLAFYDGKTYWVADGFHRIGGYDTRGVKEFPVQVLEGTRLDAIAYTCGSSRLSVDKKRTAIKQYLLDPVWNQKSNKQIGIQLKMSDHTVGRVRRGLEGEGGTLIGADGKRYPRTLKKKTKKGETTRHQRTEQNRKIAEDEKMRREAQQGVMRLARESVDRMRTPTRRAFLRWVIADTAKRDTAVLAEFVAWMGAGMPDDLQEVVAEARKTWDETDTNGAANV